MKFLAEYKDLQAGDVRLIPMLGEYDICLFRGSFALGGFSVGEPIPQVKTLVSFKSFVRFDVATRELA
jgi:hypothetical protein